MEVTTVGKLKELLKNVPDDWEIVKWDSENEEYISLSFEVWTKHNTIAV